jgi:hypothetical protein
MAVGKDIAGVRNRNVAKEEEGFYVCWIGLVEGADQFFDGLGGIMHGDGATDDEPAVGEEVGLEAVEFGVESSGWTVLDENDNCAAVVWRRNANARAKIAVAGVIVGSGFYDLIFVGSTKLNAVVRVGG